jgi:hypothetical protein
MKYHYEFVWCNILALSERTTPLPHAAIFNFSIAVTVVEDIKIYIQIKVHCNNLIEPFLHQEPIRSAQHSYIKTT